MKILVGAALGLNALALVGLLGAAGWLFTRGDHTPHTPMSIQPYVGTDRGVQLASFFFHLEQMRPKPRAPFGANILARAENSTLAHFLGLSPITAHAQFSCNGFFSGSTSYSCSAGCGDQYPDVTNGTDYCTGYEQLADDQCLEGGGCYPHQNRDTCTVPNCP